MKNQIAIIIIVILVIVIIALLLFKDNKESFQSNPNECAICRYTNNKIKTIKSNCASFDKNKPIPPPRTTGTTFDGCSIYKWKRDPNSKFRI